MDFSSSIALIAQYDGKKLTIIDFRYVTTQAIQWNTEAREEITEIRRDFYKVLSFFSVKLRVISA